MACCKDVGGKKTNGPFILGDPATIVTETDSQYLQDMVLDYHPAPVAETPKETEPTPSADTSTVAQQPATPANDPKEETLAKPEKVSGLEMDFGNAAIVITGISGKGSGTSYQLKSGSLNGKQIRATEGSLVKVSQRYQTVVVAESDMGTLVLDNLSTTTGWQALKSSGAAATISGLEERKLETPKANAASIKNAVTRATRKKRMSKRNEQKWLASVKNTRTANQKPLDVKLRSVMWKVEGKDSKGKPYSRQIRVDMPL